MTTLKRCRQSSRQCGFFRLLVQAVIMVSAVTRAVQKSNHKVHERVFDLLDVKYSVAVSPHNVKLRRAMQCVCR